MKQLESRTIIIFTLFAGAFMFIYGIIKDWREFDDGFWKITITNLIGAIVAMIVCYGLLKLFNYLRKNKQQTNSNQ